MKRCKNKKCKRLLPPSAYNNSSVHADGKQPYCRTCQSISNAQQRTKFPNIARDKYKRDRAQDPEKFKALRRLRYHIKVGKIDKGPCEICGDTNVKAYLVPPYDQLRPRWFCQGHHPNRKGHHSK
jgi:hypothetical protein